MQHTQQHVKFIKNQIKHFTFDNTKSLFQSFNVINVFKLLEFNKKEEAQFFNQIEKELLHKNLIIKSLKIQIIKEIVHSIKIALL